MWEYDSDFMSNNELSVPETDEEVAKLIELWESQMGPNAYKEQVCDNLIKVFNKNSEKERHLFLHDRHLENMRALITSKLQEGDEYLELFNK